MSDPAPGAAAWSAHPRVAEGRGRIRSGAGVSTAAPLPDWPTRLALVRGLEDPGYDAHRFPNHPAYNADCWTTPATLRRHCDDLGRSYDSVLPTHFVDPVVLAETAAALAVKRAARPPVYHTIQQGLSATPEEAVALYRPLVAAGLRYFIPHLATHDDLVIRGRCGMVAGLLAGGTGPRPGSAASCRDRACLVTFALSSPSCV